MNLLCFLYGLGDDDEEDSTRILLSALLLKLGSSLETQRDEGFLI